MGTPTFVKFSRVQGSPQEAFSRLFSEVLGTYVSSEVVFVPLRWVEVGPIGPPEVEDRDIEEIGVRISCVGEEFIRHLPGLSCFGAILQVTHSPYSIYLHAFDVSAESFSLTLCFESPLFLHRPDDQEEGEWLDKFLAAFVTGLNVDVCGYGKDSAYDVAYEALLADALLERLRSGNLFIVSYPAFHMIHIRLISVEEMLRLYESRVVIPGTEDLRYSLTTRGFHVLSLLR